MDFSRLNQGLQTIKKFGLVNQLFDYYLGRYFVRPPRHLLYITTKRCNSRCIMCQIWKETDFSQELTLQQWRHLIHQPLFSRLETITFSGGEASLRPDLSKLVKSSLSSHLKYIGIATNGLNPLQVEQTVLSILPLLKNHPHLNLSVQISLDSPNLVHSQVRGIPRAYELVRETIKKLSDLKQNYPQLYVNLSCVIMKININYLDELYSFAQKNHCQIIYSPAISSPEYYKNDHLSVSLDPASRRRAVTFLNRIISRFSDPNQDYYREVVIPILEGKHRQRLCMMGINSIVIEHDGHIPLCINAEHLGRYSSHSHLQHCWRLIHQLKNTSRARHHCAQCPAACGQGGFTFSQMFRLLN